MATMVKEKSKEKKKSKSKSSSRSSVPRELPSVVIESPVSEEINEPIITTSCAKSPEYVLASEFLEQEPEGEEYIKCIQEPSSSISENAGIGQNESIIERNVDSIENLKDFVQPQEQALVLDVASTDIANKEVPPIEIEYTYKDLSKKLDRMTLLENVADTSQEFEFLSPTPSTKAYDLEESPVMLEDITPSAPCFEVEEVVQDISYGEVVVESKPKVQCMPIEDVLRLYSGGEMEEVRGMSEREEEIVEAGPVSGPEHPLVDLLSTFRSSLMAVERERVLLTKNIADEESCRSRLWNIESRTIYMVEKCPCGLNVELTATYDYAELQRDRLPAAKMRLEAILRDLQDSYCHHQHEALLAYYQIEELISETIRSNKSVIREALSLVLMSLRVSSGAPDVLARALQRWAVALAAALIDQRDLRQLLFILHHLFKQTRSVRWASRVIQVRVDIESPVRILALLELLLARPRLDTAQECTEEVEEGWEEVDVHGDGGGVSDGTLRERDLLALLNALPIRDLVARILLFTHNDIKQARSHEWGDNSGGRSVLRACIGVRALLHVLRRASLTHHTYARLQRALRDIAARALHTLACLHMLSCDSYTPDLRDKLSSELEAAFFQGFELFESTEIHRLPATLLADETARNYCVAYIEQLHEPALLSCRLRVRIVSQAAVDRVMDHELANTVLNFLLQTGIKSKTVQCKYKCEVTAQNCLPRLFTAHPYMHTVALHTVAEMNTMEALDVTCVKALCIPTWRPTAGEARALLDDWARRCPHLLQHMLLLLDCTPNKSGLPLDVQLTIGTWLCAYVRDICTAGAVPECWWAVLRRLRTHRSAWRLPLDAPPPETEPTDLFSAAYALLSTSWGHCIPLICSDGVSALCRLAAARPRDAVHCLTGVMLVMAHSPESVAYTPKFVEVFSSLLNSGPSLMARALGRGGVAGADMLLRLILAQLDTQHVCRSSVQSAWLHALWRANMPASALAIVDNVACATRLWPQLDAYVNVLLQEENSKEHISHTVRNANTCPLLCEVCLRTQHAQHDTLVHYGYARALTELRRQRVTGAKIHVDKALQHVAANLTSDELVIYRACYAALSAPLTHPAHLTLWRLFMHLYLERAPEYMCDTEPPVGPLFFSGLIKSRTLTQIKKRLQDTIIYHHNEAATLKKTIKTNQPQSTKSTSRDSSVLVDIHVVPALTIVDLTGESSNSSDLEDSGEEKEIDRREESPSQSCETQKITSLVCYHQSAEKMLGEYSSWLEQGDRVRAAPHHADIARFIPEHAMEAAWRRAVSRPLPSEELDDFPLPTSSLPPDNTPPPTPFNTAVDNILNIKDNSRKRHKISEIKSPVADVDFVDARSLVSLVDKHLKDIEKLAHEWCSEISKISSLDSQLWELVTQLRVCRPLPLVKKQCEKKCKPITFDTSEKREWRVSTDAERAVRDNRRSALVRLRHAARARPHAARTAAALHTIARRARSSEAGVRVVERAWRCAGDVACAHCAPARSVLSALVDNLAERWICSSGRSCSQLLGSWARRGAGPLQQALCGSLVSPRRLPPADWPLVYIALLDSQLPSHALFSYLSKFEMHRWSETADPVHRRDILDALHRTVQRFGATPAPEDQMLIEILGVHTALLLTSQALPSHIKSCAISSLENKLPKTHWIHVVRAVEGNAAGVPFEQLGHLLRELGVLWWEARTGVKGHTCNISLVAQYAPLVAKLLHVLQRAFVAAAVSLSYEPERVAWYAWSSLQESWGAWVSPHAGSPPLLSSTAADEQYTPMLRHFVDNIHQIMLDCPGTEIYLLKQIFEWCVPTYASVQTVPSVTAVPSMTNVPSMTSVPSVMQESRVQASALLAELAKLPWNEHQWFYGNSLQVAFQFSTSTDHELTTWCCSVWRTTAAETLLRDVGDQLVPRLASLLYLFTGTTLPLSQMIIDEACKLPWYRLPELALDEALDRFYRLHHSVAQPYHDLPQFRIILLACELVPPPGMPSVQLSSSARSKRCVGVSQWVRAATSPGLAPHVPGHTTCLLNTLADLVTPLSSSEGELEELLSRALVVMCIEPAASSALVVWMGWLGRASVCLSLASVRGAATLTAREYAAAVGDAAVKAALMGKVENVDWALISSSWSCSPWREASTLVSRARLHVAYACALAHEHTPQETTATMHALLAAPAPIHFVDNEAIVAVWICYTARLACDGDEQLSLSARAVLSRWAEHERRSLLSRVTMQHHADKPTPLHRILCRYAQYILAPDDVTRRAFESAYTSTVTSHGDLPAWSVAPQHNKLVTLAVRLLPKYDNYFTYELSKA